MVLIKWMWDFLMLNNLFVNCCKFFLIVLIFVIKGICCWIIFLIFFDIFGIGLIFVLVICILIYFIYWELNIFL